MQGMLAPSKTASHPCFVSCLASSASNSFCVAQGKARSTSNDQGFEFFLNSHPLSSAREIKSPRSFLCCLIVDSCSSVRLFLKCAVPRLSERLITLAPLSNSFSAVCRATLPAPDIAQAFPSRPLFASANRCSAK